MAEIDDLPDLDIQYYEVKNYNANLSTVKPPNVNDELPTTIIIKRQRYPVSWSQPEQEYIITKTSVDPDNMGAFDDFLNKNIPNDPDVKPDSLKFVENVLLGRTKDRKSKVYYDAPQYKGKKCCFVISFLFN
jgi:hypothetical protein